MQYIRNVPTQFLRMVPDYLFSSTQCGLFLSLKYHSLYPNYIHRRIAELRSDFELRVLLVLVDIQDNAPALRQLNSLCVTNRLTLILSWTAEEAARYLESYKASQGKDASSIQKKSSNLYVDQVTDALTACPNINKTDAANLLGHFGSMRNLFTKGTPEELALVAGMGQVKVTRLYEAFCKPFSSKKAKQRRQRQKELLEQQEAKEKEEQSKTIADDSHHDSTTKMVTNALSSSDEKDVTNQAS
uniref:ERCC1-like central domain-containing protein n=1 Tax=Entomoneis paludosa TaxID=265537 RepID=A0A7S2Y3K3_9STRA